ncbi:MAG TPA: Rad52/Rad22 family DNA repair protein [Gemmatimonadaceae bacterium]|nr:Rad52/Rad22 family DNA repair protein [Gemmatimonadaceae bacterium]
MIARHEAHMDKSDIWSKLAGALPAGVISWRQDGKPTHRDGKYFARFVAYIEANTVRERLDSVVPGEWDLTLDLLPPIAGADSEASCSFKARLQILGVIREDVGTGKDYKQAATDAFKRAAVRFGIGHELYSYEQNWVQVDGDGKYAKPLEDPQTAYVRRYGNGSATRAEKPVRAARAGRADRAEAALETAPELETEDSSALVEAVPVGANPDNPACPKCGGKMWDNRATKRNPKAPDFKCRDRSCDGVIWPPKGAASAPRSGGSGSAPAADQEVALALDSSPLGGGVDDIPF